MTTSIQCVALICNKHAHCDGLHCQLKSTFNNFAQNCAATEEKSQPQKLNILITRRKKKQVVTSPLKFTLQSPDVSTDITQRTTGTTFTQTK